MLPEVDPARLLVVIPLAFELADALLDAHAGVAPEETEWGLVMTPVAAQSDAAADDDEPDPVADTVTIGDALRWVTTHVDSRRRLGALVCSLRDQDVSLLAALLVRRDRATVLPATTGTAAWSGPAPKV